MFFKILLYCLLFLHKSVLCSADYNPTEIGFFEGTLVRISDKEIAPIETIKKDGVVWSWHFYFKYFRLSKVTNITTRLVTKMVRITLHDGEIIEIPSEQQVYVPLQACFAPVRMLTSAENIPLFAYENMVAVSIKAEEIILPTPRLAYSLTVEDTKNFLVGPRGIMVHNNPALAHLIGNAVAAEHVLAFCESLAIACPAVAAGALVIGALGLAGSYAYPSVEKYFCDNAYPTQEPVSQKRTVILEDIPKLIATA